MYRIDRQHTEPLFKKNHILKLDDQRKLQISLFMQQHRHNTLPSSFTNTFTSQNTQNITTRQINHYYIQTPRTNFSKNLPTYNFPYIWNNLPNKLQNVQKKRTFKRKLTKLLTQQYKNEINCTNPHCKQCTRTNT